MTTVSLKSGKTPKKFMNYLVKDSSRALGSEKRYLAHDSLGLGSNGEIEAAFKGIRELHGKDSGVLFHHAAINFDPKDPATKALTDEQIIEYTNLFLEKHAYGFESATYIHRDRDHIHAHVIWNSVNTETGKKFNSDRKKLMESRELVQNLDRQFSLTFTPTPEKDGIAKTNDRITGAEIQLINRDENAYLWKSDLKSRVIKSQAIANSFDEFVSHIKTLGVSVTERGKQSELTFAFTDKEGKQRKSRASTLGEDYGKSRIDEQIRDREREIRTPKIEQEHDRRDTATQRNYDGNIDRDSSREKGDRSNSSETQRRDEVELGASFKAPTRLERIANSYYENDPGTIKDLRGRDKILELADSGLREAGLELHAKSNGSGAQVHISESPALGSGPVFAGVIGRDAGRNISVSTLTKETENGNPIHKDINARAMESNQINDSGRVASAHRLLRQGISRVDLEEQGRLSSRSGRFKESLGRAFGEFQKVIERVKAAVADISLRLETYRKEAEISKKHGIDHGINHGLNPFSSRDKDKDRDRDRGPGFGR